MMQEAEPERFEIGIDGEVFAGDFLFVEIFNLGRTGPALPISFAAAPDDGLLDVVFLFEGDRARMSRWLTDPDGAPSPVTTRKGRKIDFKWERGHARIDDRVYLPPSSATPIKIKLERDSMRVLVPDLNGAPAGISRLAVERGSEPLARLLIGIIEAERGDGDEIGANGPQVGALRRLRPATLDSDPIIGAPARIEAILDAQQTGSRSPCTVAAAPFTAPGSQFG